MAAFLAGIPFKTFTLLELSSNISSWSSEVCTLKGKITHLKLDVNRLTTTVSLSGVCLRNLFRPTDPRVGCSSNGPSSTHLAGLLLVTTTYSTDVCAGREPFIPAWLFDFGLTPQEGWVLAYLWRCRNAQTGLCNPASATIAEKANLSVRAVFAALKSLKDKGLIRVKPGNSASSNAYVLTLNGVELRMHHMHTKVHNLDNTKNTNLGMHHMHSLPKDENLGVLHKGAAHAAMLRTLKPTLSPNAYHDYRVELKGDGYATVINPYGGRTRFPFPTAV
jgi:DNA-binding MarR family transcriptional regulator